MSDFINYGRSGIFLNEDATEENKQPKFRGNIIVDRDIPKGTVLRIAGWENKQGDKAKSISLALSSKVGETASDSTYNKQKSGKAYTTDVDINSGNDEDIPF
tara:strand:+ start:182 stop:487 length:306 start_codon:yes stop_codon:yes gene_type:complete